MLRTPRVHAALATLLGDDFVISPNGFMHVPSSETEQGFHK